MAKVFNIEYYSYNEYEEAVNEAIFEYLIMPCNDNHQVLLNYSLKQSSGSEPFVSKNAYGFQTFRIRPKSMFNEFWFIMTAKVERFDDPILNKSTFSAEEQLMEVNSFDFHLDNYLYFQRTPLTMLTEEHQRNIFLYDKSMTLQDFYSGLSEFIHNNIVYKPKTTTVETTADEVIKAKKGVCQDFVHLFIAIARLQGFPCRYVSGYLEQATKLHGSSTMHAWVEAFVPGEGWVGYDPVNNIKINTSYIKVAHGKDYMDCSPLKGVLYSKGNNRTSHHVKVAQQ